MAHVEKHTHLWNDLPYEERKRLMPHVIESQRRHILQCKTKAIEAHKKHMKSLDEWIKSLNDELIKIGITKTPRLQSHAGDVEKRILITQKADERLLQD